MGLQQLEVVDVVVVALVGVCAMKSCLLDLGVELMAEQDDEVARAEANGRVKALGAACCSEASEQLSAKDEDDR